MIDSDLVEVGKISLVCPDVSLYPYITKINPLKTEG